jgi:hypothetical protein
MMQYNHPSIKVSKKHSVLHLAKQPTHNQSKGGAIMKGILVVIFVLGFACLFGAPAAAETPVVVETFTGAGTASVSMPGMSNPPYVEFQGQIIAITSVDFASGSVPLQGKMIDFDGWETDFMSMSSTYTGGVRIENLPGQIVNAYVFGLVDGGGQHYKLSGSTGDLSLGPSFSINSLDLTNNSTFQSTCETPDFHLEEMPELEGYMMRTTSSTTITSIDAANGVIDANVSGTIYAIVQIPTLTTWGFIVLAIGVIGIGITILRRRGKAGLATV